MGDQVECEARGAVVIGIITKKFLRPDGAPYYHVDVQRIMSGDIEQVYTEKNMRPANGWIMRKQSDTNGSIND